MRLLFSTILIAYCLFFAVNAASQVCNGSLGAPVINETFGHGTTFNPGPPLAAGITNLRYFNDNCGGDGGEGVYTLQTSMGSSCKGGSWQAISHDHTGDQNGYMMIINAGEQPDVFFNERVAGNALCPNTTYFFGAWIMNVLRDLPQTQGYRQPDITFRIETTDGRELKTYNTGIIPPESGPGKWVQYGTLFTTPADGSDFVVKMINNAPGGAGNDFALDDITFSPCGPLIQTGFGTIGDNIARSSCKGENLQYTLVADQQGYDSPTYQWQQNLNDGNGWKDITGQTNKSTSVTIPNSAPGKYQYRIGILNASQVGSEACRIYSDPLTIDVYSPPTVTLASSISGCRGFQLQLGATGGDTYEWTGPNGFTSASSSPTVSYNASPANNGVYRVRVTRNGCDSYAETTVTVYDQATVQPMPAKLTCVGTPVQLTPQTANATRFKWSPSAGLDHDDIANPMANPSATTIYQLEVSNGGGCLSTEAVTVRVLAAPVADAGPKIRMTEGQTARLNGTAKGDSIVSVFWTPSAFLDNPASLTPTTSATDDITYTLHVLSGTCGESTSDVVVRVYKLVTAPNTFSPNNDGVNDLWHINNLNSYPQAQVSIFTKGGQRVYQSIGYAKPWDGTSNGRQLPNGTYYYVINLKEDNLPPISGWVVILR